MGVRVCVCVCERQRDTETERQRQRDRETERQRERQRERETEREKERERERVCVCVTRQSFRPFIDPVTHTHTHTHTHTQCTECRLHRPRQHGGAHGAQSGQGKALDCRAGPERRAQGRVSAHRTGQRTAHLFVDVC